MSLDIKKIESYLEFIDDTLVPDLKESGNEATAEDFETLSVIVKELIKENKKLRDEKGKGE